MTETPILTNAIIGFRVWRVGDNLELLPTAGFGFPWVQGVNKAVCGSEEYPDEDYNYETDEYETHSAPSLDCQCGLHGYYDLDEARGHSGEVIGMIAIWGRVITASNGFRAEYAEPLAIYAAKGGRPKHRVIVDAVAELYEIPVITNRDMLLAYAQEHGSLMPDEYKTKQEERKKKPQTAATFNSAMRTIMQHHMMSHKALIGAQVKVPIKPAPPPLPWYVPDKHEVEEWVGKYMDTHKMRAAVYEPGHNYLRMAGVGWEMWVPPSLQEGLH